MRRVQKICCKMNLSHSPSIAIVDLSSFIDDSKHQCDLVNKNNEIKDSVYLRNDAQIKAALELHKAFQDTGFAIVINHGLEEEKVDRLRELSLEYFSYEISRKSSLANHDSMMDTSIRENKPSKPHYQYMTESVAQLLGDFNQPRDLVESLTYRGNFRQQFLSGKLQMPKEPEGFAEAIVNFESSCHRTRQILTHCVEYAFDLENKFLSSLCSVEDESLRLAHYPDVPNPSGQLRFGAHVDTYGLTMLMLDPKHPEGLQVLVKSSGGEEWIDVPYIKNSIVINVGALLSRWTGGLWKAAIHRVKHCRGRRLSIVSGAVKPRNDVVIKTLHSKDVNESQIDYPPILVEDFIRERIKLHFPEYLNDKDKSNTDSKFIKTLEKNIQGYQI